jgi:hypothetical protein
MEENAYQNAGAKITIIIFALVVILLTTIGGAIASIF